MSEISQEAIERAIDFARYMARKPIDDRFMGYEAEQARNIVALLPDPNNIEARQIASSVLMRLGASPEMIAAGDIRAGKGDDMIVMHVARECLARGRELALKARAEGEKG